MGTGLPDGPELARHAANAVARHSRRGWRLDKPRRDAPIDAIVALAMAVERARFRPEPVRLLGWFVRPCLRCGRLTAGAYCRAHAHPLGSPHAWGKLRAQILARDRWTCQDCGAPAGDVDHITPRAFGGPDTPHNLQAL